MSPARLAAHALEVLGRVNGPIAVVGPESLRRAVSASAPLATDAAPAAAIVSFVGARADVPARQASLATLHARLPAGAPLALVDHNQPRGWGLRLVAAVWLALRGFGPARGRYPSARELQALGFRVERLRLTAGERLQVVLARR